MTEDVQKAEKILRGVAASPGVAHGEVFVILQKEHDIPIFQVEDALHSQEVARFEEALSRTHHQIASVRNEVAKRLGEEEAKIFDAHLMVLEDKALIDEVISEMEDTGYNVEYCFRSVCERFIEAFSTLQDEYIRERVADIRDVEKRVLDNLLGETSNSLAEMAADRIIASEDIAPSDAAELEQARVLGIVTDAGSRTSHTVIMARSLSIPAVVGLHDVTQRLMTGDYIIVDGYEGLVIINPTEATLYRYGELKEERKNIQKVFRSSAQKPAETQDKHTLPVYANIGSLEDCDEIREAGGEGVGLFRTEALFMKADGFPTEEEQFQIYHQVAQRLNPLPVVIRTLDLGGDKYTSAMAFGDPESNPFMGFRAVRFCLEHQDVFKDQLRAILRASAFGNVRIMYPMISGVQELLQANAVLDEAKDELRERKAAFDENTKVGSMIEIPSAAVTADLLAQHCDFFSIGTNDLIQYLLAVDRVNDRIAHLYNPNHPAVLRTLAQIMEAGNKAKIPVGICGEMATDPLYVPLLFGLGAHEISATASALPEIKFMLRQIKLKDAQDLAKDVLNESEPDAIADMLETFYLNHMEHVVGKK
ncbi:phosphoenolpyruvate--protein phosphotransferase [Rubellicoccus peritrichatus]|uniref:Phosphoenolpyruvate-protein phosphotransferase n=1 Tax=Rubellicoccus peritrichatus TaxID=3080537 RepID=A0AAQ3LD70_9BACT|nr:phosphoenolpyruvate--protein phosphotransferase [Puniceicoccus sp. CR14]WOO41398.1 phosphoenolpyruvate--protein phosphotransferase [Puniceicoccus sp. CR14]